MKDFKNMTMAMVLGLSLGVTLTLSHQVLAKAEAEEPLPLADIRLFTDVYARVKRDYVEAVDDHKLIEGAIRGMIASLDPHSSFLGEDEFSELQIGTSGEFGGLGIEVGLEGGFIRVIAPIDDTPAYRAGVKAGDLIIQLGDKSVKGMSLSQAVKLMRGAAGTTLVLKVVRESEAAPIDIPVMRDVIRIKSVRNRLLDDDIGYIRVTSFQSKTTRNVFAAVDSLVAKAGNDLRGVVLDLRNNPGGVLTGAVGVSDIFLNDGELIVYTEGRAADAALKYSAGTPDKLQGLPVVVLINEGSASASEIVAGALQDHKRATLVGSKSFGKGSVQTVLPLQENAALKLTTARYFTPLGRSIQNSGIVPDIAIEVTNKVSGEVKKANEFVREVDLEGHLENNEEVSQGTAGKVISVRAEKDKDVVLDVAIGIMKKMIKTSAAASQKNEG
ncbi:S41 family peptidase [Gammaproteobacteria bacterium]|jgi:carboxyl-terminal processing protease|nr:S41 family peptidase [Gammaproteobacteria bacterium]